MGIANTLYSSRTCVNKLISDLPTCCRLHPSFVCVHLPLCHHFLISEVISSGAHSIFYGLVSPGEYHMLSLLRDNIIKLAFSPLKLRMCIA